MNFDKDLLKELQAAFDGVPAQSGDPLVREFIKEKLASTIRAHISSLRNDLTNSKAQSRYFDQRRHNMQCQIAALIRQAEADERIADHCARSPVRSRTEYTFYDREIGNYYETTHFFFIEDESGSPMSLSSVTYGYGSCVSTTVTDIDIQVNDARLRADCERNRLVASYRDRACDSRAKASDLQRQTNGDVAQHATVEAEGQRIELEIREAEQRIKAILAM